MTPQEFIQLVLGLVAIGGIGGIWFRLGALVERTEAHHRRITNLEQWRRKDA